jgi:hypothetical protein
MKLLTTTALILASLTAPAMAQTVPVDHRTDTKTSIPWKTVMKQENGANFVDHWDKPPVVDPRTGDITTKGEGEHDWTLALVVSHALYTGIPGEKPDADVDYPRAVLAHEIMTNPPATLTTDELATIKKLVGANYPAIIVGQVFPILFPNDKPGAIR